MTIRENVKPLKGAYNGFNIKIKDMENLYSYFDINFESLFINLINKNREFGKVLNNLIDKYVIFNNIKYCNETTNISRVRNINNLEDLSSKFGEISQVDGMRSAFLFNFDEWIKICDDKTYNFHNFVREIINMEILKMSNLDDRQERRLIKNKKLK